MRGDTRALSEHGGKMQTAAPLPAPLKFQIDRAQGKHQGENNRAAPVRKNGACLSTRAALLPSFLVSRRRLE